MVVDLDLPEAVRQKLTSRAATRGVSMAKLIEQMIEHEVERPTWAEIAAPLQDAMRGHGMTDEELLRFFESERAAMRRERRTSEEGSER